MPRYHIVSDGTPMGTEVVDLATGRVLTDVLEVEVRLTANHVTLHILRQGMYEPEPASSLDLTATVVPNVHGIREHLPPSLEDAWTTRYPVLCSRSEVPPPSSWGGALLPAEGGQVARKKSPEDQEDPSQ